MERDSARTRAGKAAAVRYRPLRKAVPSLARQAVTAVAEAAAGQEAYRGESVELLRSIDAKLREMVKGQRTLYRTLERLCGPW